VKYSLKVEFIACIRNMLTICNSRRFCLKLRLGRINLRAVLEYLLTKSVAVFCCVVNVHLRKKTTTLVGARSFAAQGWKDFLSLASLDDLLHPCPIVHNFVPWQY